MYITRYGDKAIMWNRGKDGQPSSWVIGHIKHAELFVKNAPKEIEEICPDMYSLWMVSDNFGYQESKYTEVTCTYVYLLSAQQLDLELSRAKSQRGTLVRFFDNGIISRQSHDQWNKVSMNFREFKTYSNDFTIHQTECGKPESSSYCDTITEFPAFQVFGRQLVQGTSANPQYQVAMITQMETEVESLADYLDRTLVEMNPVSPPLRCCTRLSVRNLTVAVSTDADATFDAPDPNGEYTISPEKVNGRPIYKQVVPETGTGWLFPDTQNKYCFLQETPDSATTVCHPNNAFTIDGDQQCAEELTSWSGPAETPTFNCLDVYKNTVTADELKIAMEDELKVFVVRFYDSGIVQG